MNDSDVQKIVTLLEDIREGQKRQLELQTQAVERQAEAVARQQERFAKFDLQVGGSSEIQHFAGKLQESARLINRARVVMFFFVPLLLLVLVFVCWLAFHRDAP